MLSPSNVVATERRSAIARILALIRIGLSSVMREPSTKFRVEGGRVPRSTALRAGPPPTQQQLEVNSHLGGQGPWRDVMGSSKG